MVIFNPSSLRRETTIHCGYQHISIVPQRQNPTHVHPHRHFISPYAYPLGRLPIDVARHVLEFMAAQHQAQLINAGTPSQFIIWWLPQQTWMDRLQQWVQKSEFSLRRVTLNGR